LTLKAINAMPSVLLILLVLVLQVSLLPSITHDVPAPSDTVSTVCIESKSSACAEDFDTPKENSNKKPVEMPKNDQFKPFVYPGNQAFGV
jgi:hypothetical protein